MHTLIFDFGNVIYSFDREVFFQKLLERSNIRETKARRIFYYDFGEGGSLEERVSRGEMSSQEFFRSVKDEFNSDITRQKFDEIYCSMFEPNTEVINLIKKLSEDYRLQIFSDINPIHYENAVKECEVYNLFDAETLSFRVGTLKRKKKGYKDAISKANARRLKIAFMDDKREYAERARSMGIQGIQFKGYEDLVSRLRELGVEV